PGDGAFDSPASFAAPQGSAILGWRAIEPVGCDHLDTLSGQRLIETVTIVSFVTDDSGRCALSNHETKELLDEMAFSGISWGAAACGHRQPGRSMLARGNKPPYQRLTREVDTSAHCSPRGPFRPARH